MASGHTPYLFVMLLAGVGIPFMGASNARLGMALGNPMLAVVILCVIATAGALILVLVFPFESTYPTRVPGLPILFAGLLFVFYITSITHAAPRIGLGTAICLVVFGQLLSAVVIDHNGWLGATVTPISIRRTLGLVLIGAGVVLAVSGAQPGGPFSEIAREAPPE